MHFIRIIIIPFSGEAYIQSHFHILPFHFHYSDVNVYKDTMHNSS